MAKKILFVVVLYFMCGLGRMNAQEISLRSSATMWLTATPNIEVSFPVSKHWTVHLPVLYNPWVFKDNSRFQRLTTMPGVRWWRQQANLHYFVSVYGLASRFHVGGWFNNKYRYDGKAFGGGIGGGYSFALSRHWNIEAELGIGYAYTEYDKCGWYNNSRLVEHYKGWKIIPTKVDISFVYFY